MASAWSEETFSCSVCLETLKDPATLPCGHSYCLVCIQNHWDKGSSKGQYTCPQCRQVFKPRPSLSKSTLLVEAMEKLRTNSFKITGASSAPPPMPTYMDVLPDTGPQPGCIYPQLPTVAPKMCRQHNQPLDLFCHEDKENVCALCGQHGHKGHQVVKLGDERRQRQEELVHMQQEVQRRVQQTERTLKELPHKARQHKALVQALQTENTDLFSDLVKTVNVTGNQIGELLDAHEASLGSQVEGNIQRLEQEVAQLHWRSEELSRLADMQDNIFFLKNFFMVEPLGAAEGSGMGQQEAAVVASIRSVIKSLYSSIENQCNDSVAKIQGLRKDGATAAAANGNPTMTDADETCQTSKQSTVYETVLPATDPVAPTCPHASAPPLPPPRPQATPVTSVELAYPEPKTREEMLKSALFLCLLGPVLAQNNPLEKFSSRFSWNTVAPENVGNARDIGTQNVCVADQAACGCCLMQQQIEKLKSRFNNTLDELQAELTKAVSILNQFRSTRGAFSVALSTESELKCFGPFRDDVLITYKHIFLNMGDHYDMNTGIFTVPRSGVYNLALTIYSDAGAPGNTLAACGSLQVNGQMLSSPRELNMEDHEDSATIVIAVQLKAGDKVSVNLPIGCFLCDNNSHYNTFSGFLLYATE